MLKPFLYILLFSTLLFFYFINTLVPETHMDEIFHFRQAMKYYKGIYNEWDPKITTPPGLYMFTVLILTPLSSIASLDVGKIACFRLINIIFTIGTFLVVYKTLKHLHKDDEQRVVLLSSFNITVFPVLYFFNFLYYTDCGSAFLVLLMHYQHLKKSYRSAAAVGALAILFRQTNIVWVFFVAAYETLHALLMLCNESLSKKDKKIINLTSLEDLRNILMPLLLKSWKKILSKMFQINTGYIAVATSFVSFIIYNGSVALGDKNAHEVCIHPPQLLYFMLFSATFASPYLISVKNMKKFLCFASSHKMLMFEMSCICAFSVIYMSHVHPYLLADNSHYSFYVWRRIFGRNLALSLGLIPLYIFCGWSLYNAIQYKLFIFKVVFGFCVVIAVVPQKLFEFRYFIIPYIMLRLHFKVESHWQPYLEFVLYSAVNFVTLYLFMFQTLPWESTERSVRLMW